MRTSGMVIVMVFVMLILSGNVYGGMEGSSNTLFGTGSGANLGDDDDQATFIGYQAGYNTIDGTVLYEGKYNTFVGYKAGYSNTTGDLNNFLGYLAGYSNTTGGSNTFLGIGAGYHNTTGTFNSFIGSNAGQSNTTGFTNSFIGNEAGLSNTTGYENSFIGLFAGGSNTTGYGNTFVGTYTGGFNSTGNGNVFLGYGAGGPETGSNKLYISNSDTSTPLIYGEFDNKRMTINGNLEVIGPDNGLIRLSDVTTDNTTKRARMVLHHYSNAQLPGLSLWCGLNLCPELCGLWGRKYALAMQPLRLISLRLRIPRHPLGFQD